MVRRKNAGRIPVDEQQLRSYGSSFGGVLRMVSFVKSLPRAANGKPLLQKLRSRALDRARRGNSGGGSGLQSPPRTAPRAERPAASASPYAAQRRPGAMAELKPEAFEPEDLDVALAEPELSFLSGLGAMPSAAALGAEADAELRPEKEPVSVSDDTHLTVLHERGTFDNAGAAWVTGLRDTKARPKASLAAKRVCGGPRESRCGRACTPHDAPLHAEPPHPAAAPAAASATVASTSGDGRRPRLTPHPSTRLRPTRRARRPRAPRRRRGSGSAPRCRPRRSGGCGTRSASRRVGDAWRGRLLRASQESGWREAGRVWPRASRERAASEPPVDAPRRPPRLLSFVNLLPSVPAGI